MAQAPGFLWITDPWDTLDHERDTSLRLMQAAQAMGVPTFWTESQALSLCPRTLKVTAPVCSLLFLTPERSARSIERVQLGTLPIDGYIKAVYRTDPPVDGHYLRPLQLLNLVPGLELINPFDVLVGINEKFGGALPGLGTWMPETLVSAQLDELIAFVTEHSKTGVVLKPLDQAQSKGVLHLKPKGRGVGASHKEVALIQKATHQGTESVLLQVFQPWISQGETRLWMLDGRLLGAFRKHPLKGDFRVKIDSGSRLSRHTLTAGEKKAARAIGRVLRERRVRLAAVDLIGDRISDFNVTSPGLLVQMEQLYRKDFATAVVRRLVK